MAQLEWRRKPGGESCIAGPALKRAVERRYERRIFTGDPTAEIVVRGEIGPARGRTQRRADTWNATVALSTPDGTSLGTRTLTTNAEHCSSLDDSLALALGLMLDMTQAELEEAREARAEPAPAAPTGRRGDSSAIRIPEDTYAPRQPWHWEVSAALVAGAGLTPGLGWGGRAGLGLEPPHFWKMELSAALWARTSTSTEVGASDFSMWTVALGVCPFETGAEVRLEACVVQRAGIVESSGRQFDQNHRERNSLLDLGLAGRLKIPVAGPLVARLGLSAEVPLLRYRFVYVDEAGHARQLHRVWPVVFLGYAGAALHF